MRQACWQVRSDRGFLLNPSPVVRLDEVLNRFPAAADALAQAEAISDDLANLMETGRIRAALDALPPADLQPLCREIDTLDFRAVERLMQIYAYFANAYVYATGETPAQHIPKGVAVPLVQLGEMVERPPILTYAGYVLANWELVDPNGAITVDNTRLVQNLLGNSDESWFIRIHVDIEARAAEALLNIQTAAATEDASTLETALAAVHHSLRQMTKSFKRMPQGCDADAYYYKVRPYLFGFNDIVYEGTFGDQPQSFRGQTGAQSSVIPALVAGLGLRHEGNGLTQHLDVMKDYMPKPHREFIATMHHAGIREAVLRQRDNTALVETYNECLRRVLEFRRLHYQFANSYIAAKVKNPVGTGGTLFMDWLKQLAQETEQQLI